jgi:hypothetical protein
MLQDHWNDVLTNAVAVGCVFAAALGGADSPWCDLRPSRFLA